MLAKINIYNILFLDIETVPKEPTFSNLTEEEQKLFAEKTAYQRKENDTVEDFYQKAGIWAEFGKIVCISVAYFVTQAGKEQLRVKSFFSEDEYTVLTNFKDLLDTHFNKKEHLLCAHNGKEFDFPYIARRMVIHQIILPKQLNLFGKKPWEVNHLDTMELWRFGDFKHYTSLKLLTTILGIPSPKQDIDGSEVAKVYYQEKNLQRIVTYCEKDTVAVAQLLLRFLNKPILPESHIVVV